MELKHVGSYIIIVVATERDRDTEREERMERGREGRREKGEEGVRKGPIGMEGEFIR